MTSLSIKNSGGRECYHCGLYLSESDRKTHDCWTTTEEALTQDLSEDLRDAWLRIRETAVAFGEQRIYASHRSIMFARKNCYFFVRPKTSNLEVCFFLGRTERNSRIKKSQPSSKVKVSHLVLVKHRDEVERPLTDWLREAYEFSEIASQKKPVRTKKRSKGPARKKPARKKRKAKPRR